MEYVRLNSYGKLVLPKKVPKQRTNLVGKLQIIFSLLMILGSIYFINGDTLFTKISVAGYAGVIIAFALIAVEYVKRVFLFVEELNSLHSRYDDSYEKLVCSVFGTETRVIVTFSVCCFYLFIWRNTLLPDVIDGNYGAALIMILMATMMVSKSLHLNHNKLYDSLAISKMKGLDYGTGMAHSFFHGYLKIMLPSDGFSENNLEHLMKKYESTNHILFQTYKLYILVPLSLYCPTTLESSFSPSVLSSQTLESIKRDRAGVQKRVYKNSVYKIKFSQDEEPIYVCAEYATPLHTFFESISAQSCFAEHYKENKKDIIWNFYTMTMKLINEDPTVKGLCELIYFDDKDVRGDDIDVGKLLFKKILKERKQLIYTNL